MYNQNMGAVDIEELVTKAYPTIYNIIVQKVPAHASFIVYNTMVIYKCFQPQY